MIKKNIILTFYLSLYRQTLCSDYFASTSLINVSIFLRSHNNNNTLHIFFLKGEFTVSDRSLQYYFLEDIQFTHTSFQINNPVEFKGSRVQLNVLLKNLVNNKQKMLEINKLAKIQIRPFVFSFVNKSDNSAPSTEDLKVYEEDYFNQNKFLTNQDRQFKLYGNHFDLYKGILKTRDIYSSTTSQVNVLVDLFKDTKTINNKSVTIYKPCGFTILDSNGESYLKTKPETFFKFDFANYGAEWVIPERKATNDDKDSIVFNNKIKKSSLELQIINNLKVIFSRNSQSKQSSLKLFTHFVSSKYRTALQNMLIFNQHVILYRILHTDDKEYEFYVLENIQEDDLYIKLKDKYNILMELKPSFQGKVLKTKPNVFAKYSNKIKKIRKIRNITKDAGRSKILTIVVIILGGLILLGLGAIFIYYWVSKNQRRKKCLFQGRNRK